MMRDKRAGQSESSGGLGLRILKWIAFLLSVPVLLYIFTVLLIARRQPELDRKLSELQKQFPHEPTNASALKLELVVSGLGLDISTRDSGRIRVEKETAQANTKVREDAFSYLDVQLARPSAYIDAPPKSVMDYLALKKTQFDAVEDQLLHEPIPKWEVNVADLDLRLPNLLELMALEKFLILRALSEHQAGHSAEADKNREAAWNLNESLWKRPEFISMLVAGGMERYEMGAARKMDVSPQWIERFASHDYARHFRTALLSETCTMNIHARRRSRDETESAEMLLLRSAPLQPYLRLCAVNLTDRNAADAESVLLHPICDFAEASSEKSMPLPLAFWNILRSEEPGPMSRAWSRFARLTLDRELTQKILELKEQRDRTGQWPVSIPSGSGSACSDSEWKYTVAPEGHVTMEFARKLQWADAVGLILPLQFYSE